MYKLINNAVYGKKKSKNLRNSHHKACKQRKRHF